MALSPNHEWSDPSLRQLDEVVNMDVDATADPIHRGTGFLVVDTNILIGYLDVLQDFVRVIEQYDMPIEVVVPGIVLVELDGQKKLSDSLGWSARRASTWIFQKVQEGPKVRVQPRQATCQKSGDWRDRDKGLSNDDLIIDCAQYYREIPLCSVAIVSADRNLCTTCLAQGMRAVCPKDRRFLYFSSRTLAGSLYEWNQAVVQHFPDNPMKPRSRALQKAIDSSLPPDPTIHPGEAMELDDTHVEDVDPKPSHLLDILHVDVIEHFSPLLLKLIRRVSSWLFEEVPSSNGSSASIHSPLRLGRPEYWTARECVEHLARQALLSINAKNRQTDDKDTKERMSVVKQGSGRLAAFLTHRYERGAASRKGQEWSREDWVYCLTVLKSLGEVWKDEHILASLDTLGPQLDDIFATPMRPTGT